MTTLPANQPPRVFPPTGQAGLPLRPTVRTHCLPRNLWPANNGATSATINSVSVSRLIAMLDCEHSPDSRYVVVSKQSSRGPNVTSVLDAPLRKFYRAEHPHGLVTLWKNIARHSAGAVKFVPKGEDYRPEQPPAVQSRPY